MNNITAAQDARRNVALDKPFYTDTLSTTWREAIDSGVIAYGRVRTFSTGKRTYGVILADDIMDSAETASFYDAPKYVVDACPAIVNV